MVEDRGKVRLTKTCFVQMLNINPFTIKITLHCGITKFMIKLHAKNVNKTAVHFYMTWLHKE